MRSKLLVAVLAVVILSTGAAAQVIVNISSPVPATTASSPVRVVASAQSTSRIRSIQVFVDGVKVSQVNSGSFDRSLSMATGTRELVVEALDQKKNTGRATVRFTVGEPQASITPLAITTLTLPNGVVGTAYDASLAATGGTSPYTWSLVSGKLPDGLSLASTGRITGTPKSTGEATFWVQVVDSASPKQGAQSSFIIKTLSAASEGTVLWSADHETGNLSQWYWPGWGGGEYNSGNALSSASRDVARNSLWSLKMTINTPPESGVRLFRWKETNENLSRGLYFRTWYYFPHRFQVSGWWNIMQWKSTNATKTNNDPFFMLDIKNRSDGAMYLYLYNWKTKTNYYQTVKNLPVGQWVLVEAFYYCNEGNGRIAIWQDGTKLFDMSGVLTAYTGDCAWSVNNYGSGITPNPATIYADDAAIIRK